MFVIKRNGDREEVKFDKITDRVKKLCFGLNTYYVNPTKVAQKVSIGMIDNITTNELDVLASNVCKEMCIIHPDYNLLSGRIMVSNLQKTIVVSFSEAMDKLYHYINPKTKKHAPVISKSTWEIVMANATRLDNAIIDERDFVYKIFGIQTLKRSYLLRCGNTIYETPQYMHLRVAIGIHGDDIDGAIEMYDKLSRRLYTHSTPTIFNSGTPRPQMASCFLLANEEDSIDGIFDTVKKCAQISKFAGGIGLHIHNIRSTGSYIEGTNGTSNGIVPFLKVFNSTSRAVNQGGKRKGSFAMYLEPHHADIFQFIKLHVPGGQDDLRAHDLFLAVWLSDLFMERVFNDDKWTLFDPNVAVGLDEVYGDEYRELYTRYEREGLGTKIVSAQRLLNEISKAQVESGMPYLLNKDAANKKSNQKNLGTIKSSNLCSEIIQYSSKDEIATCNLCQINLSQFVDEKTHVVDYDGLVDMARYAIRKLNLVIDKSFYPVPQAKVSNMKHRPLGLGVSGLHDVFFKLKLKNFDCPEARVVNKRIFESIYRGAILESIQLAKEDGPYESFKGSPSSEGILQFDMWGLKEQDLFWDDWSHIKEQVITYGLRNSLLTALMPTASSAIMFDVVECFEIQTSNFYKREVMSGSYTVINKYLVEELDNIGLWSDAMSNNIMGNDGSVQHIDIIPQDIKERYKTVWEYKMRNVIDMSADRGCFVDQSQSLNLSLAQPTFHKITAMHKYSWKKGLKTMIYYLRTRAATEAAKFTVDKEHIQDKKEEIKLKDYETEQVQEIVQEEDEECLACSA